jgi:spore coat protein U-like protein
VILIKNKFKDSSMKKELNKTKGVFVKKSKMSLAKSTTALTCLVGVLIVTSEPGLAVTTTTGSLAVSTSVASTCTVSAASMAFAAYTGSLITATSEITANCTNGTAYTISFNDAADGVTASTYKLIRATTDGSASANYIEASFTKSAGSTMTAGAATITGTGTGSAATAGTITGSIAASQTGKTAGTFSKTMTLNIVY